MLKRIFFILILTTILISPDLHPQSISLPHSLFKFDNDVWGAAYSLAEDLKLVGEFSKDAKKINEFYSHLDTILSAYNYYQKGDYTNLGLEAFKESLGFVLNILSSKKYLGEFAMKGISASLIGIAVSITIESYRELWRKERAMWIEVLHGTLMTDPHLYCKKSCNDILFNKNVTVIRTDQEAVNYVWNKVLTNEHWRNMFCSYIYEKLGKTCPDPESMKRESGIWKSILVRVLLDSGEIITAEKRKMCLDILFAKLSNIIKKLPEKERMLEIAKYIEKANKTLDRCEKLAASITPESLEDESTRYKAENCIQLVSDIPPIKFNHYAERKEKILNKIYSALSKYREIELKKEMEEDLKEAEKYEREISINIPTYTPSVSIQTLHAGFPEAFKNYCLKDYCSYENEKKMMYELFLYDIENGIKVYEEAKGRIHDQIDRIYDRLETAEGKTREVLEKKLNELIKALWALASKSSALYDLKYALEREFWYLKKYYDRVVKQTEKGIRKALGTFEASAYALAETNRRIRHLDLYLTGVKPELENILSVPIKYFPLKKVAQKVDLPRLSYRIGFYRGVFVQILGDLNYYEQPLKKLEHMKLPGGIDSVESEIESLEAKVEDQVKACESNLRRCETYLGEAEFVRDSVRKNLEERVNRIKKIFEESRKAPAKLQEVKGKYQIIRNLYAQAEEHLKNGLDELNRIRYLKNKISHADQKLRGWELTCIYDVYPKGKCIVNLRNPSANLEDLKRNIREVKETVGDLAEKYLPNLWKSLLGFEKLIHSTPGPPSSGFIIFRNKVYPAKVLLNLKRDILRASYPYDVLRYYGFRRTSDLDYPHLLHPRDKMEKLLDDIKKAIHEKNREYWSMQELKSYQNGLSSINSRIQAFKKQMEKDLSYYDSATLKGKIEGISKEINLFIRGLSVLLKNGEIIVASHWEGGKRIIDESYKLTPSARSKLQSLLGEAKKLKSDWDLWSKKLFERLKESKMVAKVCELYNEFEMCYDSKNLPCIIDLLSPNWSSFDGTTVDDVEEILENSFDTFDRIEYSISNLRVSPIGNGRFKVSYRNKITGVIYSQRITHTESADVVELVGMENGKLRILKTLQGHFWKR